MTKLLLRITFVFLAWNPTTRITSISHADAVRKCEHLYAPTQTLLAENLSKSSSAKQTGTFCRLCATFLFFNILLGMGMYFVLRPIAYVLGVVHKLRWPNFAHWPPTYPLLNVVSEFLYCHKEKSVYRWHFQLYHLPTSSYQRSLWMTHT